MLRSLCCVLLAFSLSACVSEPVDPSFRGARAFDADEASKTRVSLGLTYLQNGNFSQAKFNLDKALEFAPRNGQAHYAMAFYYQQVDEPELAEESYETALSYSRNDPDVVNSYGAFLCKQGKYEKAKEYFLKAVNDRNYASTAETYENLAICSQSQGKNQEAIAYFNSALNHQPTRAQSLFLLTRLYVEQEQWEKAKRTLFKYERNAQVSAETLYLQFQIAQGLNDTKTAVGYGEILKSMFPDHPNTEKYLVQMGKFQPSATVTRKIREKAKVSDSGTMNGEELAKVIEDTSVLVVSEETVTEESVSGDISTEQANEADKELQAAAETETQADASLAQTTSTPAEVKLSAEEIGYSSVSEITIIDTTKPEDDAAIEETDTTVELIESVPETTTIVDIQESTVEDTMDGAETLADDNIEQSDAESNANIDDLEATELVVVEESTIELAQTLVEDDDSEELVLVEVQSDEVVVAELAEESISRESGSAAELADVESETSAVLNEQESILETEEQEALITETTMTSESDGLTVELDETSVEINSTDVQREESAQQMDQSLADADTDALALLDTEKSDESPEYHTVVKGENLYRISLKYNVKMQSLLEWNDIIDASAVRIGSQLRVREPSNND